MGARGAERSQRCRLGGDGGHGCSTKDGGELLTLAVRLRRVAGAFERFVSHITRQYVGHVLGLVKSYWPTTRLDVLGKGAKADCTDEQFRQYVEETSVGAVKIVESLNKPDSP